jgi:predicted protein tyrosine phosphatase
MDLEDRQRVLFVCSQNAMRSPTAEALYRGEPDLEVASAGTNEDAVSPVSEEVLGWADTIVVMEGHHRRELQSRFRLALAGKRVVVLGIPDHFGLMEPALIAALRATEHLWRERGTGSV